MSILPKLNKRIKQTPAHVYTIGMGLFFVGLTLLVDVIINALPNNELTNKELLKIFIGVGIFVSGLLMVSKSQEQDCDTK